VHVSKAEESHFKPGKGDTVEEAAAHAWENARASGAKPGKYLVSKIEIEAENPIRTYIVTIEPGG
jgi:hypothetical protein